MVLRLHYLSFHVFPISGAFILDIQCIQSIVIGGKKSLVFLFVGLSLCSLHFLLPFYSVLDARPVRVTMENRFIFFFYSAKHEEDSFVPG